MEIKGFKLPADPMSHQRKALRRAWPQREFALFHEMGCGKTFTTIVMAVTRYLYGQINCVVVICPDSVKPVWPAELQKWSPIPVDVTVIKSGFKLNTERKLPLYDGSADPLLRCIVASTESMSQGGAYGMVAGWMGIQDHALLVVDESSRIKNPKSTRTKRITSLGGFADYRMILTGTSIVQGIHDLYAQMTFLNASILNMKSFFQFRARYCVMGGFEGKKIVRYQNVDDLMERLAPYVDVVKKADALDLPPKVYETITVKVTPEQAGLISTLKDDHEVERNGKYLASDRALDRLTRFQQIIGGHFPFRDLDTMEFKVDVLDSIPKLDAMLEVIEDDIPADCSIIIWARFRPEIALIAGKLRSIYGENSVVEFHGGVNDDDREVAKDRFNAKQSRFFVSNQSSGGIGLTLNAATYVIYYSNTFSSEDRSQSEDRCHRNGQENKVTYIDIEADHNYDRMIMKAVRHKIDMREMVDGRFKDLSDLA